MKSKNKKLVLQLTKLYLLSYNEYIKNYESEKNKEAVYKEKPKVLVLTKNFYGRQVQV